MFKDRLVLGRSAMYGVMLKHKVVVVVVVVVV